ncbi:MAG: hypothetical protein QOI40_5072, partial [Alphaproteobacteria bacterium]|nr:hypothetical protein [Alphaproteobacteria bacterium]
PAGIAHRDADLVYRPMNKVVDL